jgi:two-component system response regulator PilR (NtrC family)
LRIGRGADARRALSENSYDRCFTDMRLPDGNGQDVIELIAETCPDTPVAR